MIIAEEQTNVTVVVVLFLLLMITFHVGISAIISNIDDHRPVRKV